MNATLAAQLVAPQPAKLVEGWVGDLAMLWQTLDCLPSKNTR